MTVAACVAALAFAGEEEARATTFCVPGFTAACPNNGSNVAEPVLEKAMGLNGTDGVADEIVVAAGTVFEDGSFEPVSGLKNPASFEPVGSDPLTIVGAGIGATTLTTSGSGNVFMVDLNTGSRAVTIRDLTIEVPAGFPDGLGAAMNITKGDTLEEAAVTSANEGSDGVIAFGTGNLVRRVEIHGSGAGGEIRDGLKIGSAGATLTAEDSRIEGASWGLVGNGAGGTLTARRIVEVGTRTYGAIASEGTVTVENSIFTLDDGVGIYASGAAVDGAVDADHLTVVNEGGTGPALEGKKFSGTAGDASIHVANSIFRGFGSGYKIESPIGPGIGIVTVAARYSNIPGNGSNLSGTVDFATGNGTADPQLLPDFSLPAGSPAVDAGDPAAGGLATDFLGNPRPLDGSGDGVAVRDQGAFEYKPPAPPGGGGGEGGGQGGGSDRSGGGQQGSARPPVDTLAPQTKILAGPGAKLADGIAKFRLRSSEAGSSFQCRLVGPKLAAKTKPCKSPKRYAGLAPGRYVFKVWATDAAGNRSTPAKRSFSVPPN